MVAKAEEGGRGLNWEFGLNRCTPVYIEWINDKVLLYSIGNYIQYPMVNHNGKEYVYICITESLCCTAIIQHCIPYFNEMSEFNYLSMKKNFKKKSRLHSLADRKAFIISFAKEWQGRRGINKTNLMTTCRKD